MPAVRSRCARAVRPRLPPPPHGAAVGKATEMRFDDDDGDAPPPPANGGGTERFDALYEVGQVRQCGGGRGWRGRARPLGLPPSARRAAAERWAEARGARPRSCPFARAQVLGKGTYGAVRMCRHRQSGRDCAVKIIDKLSTDSSLEDLAREIAMLADLKVRSGAVGLWAGWLGWLG